MTISQIPLKTENVQKGAEFYNSIFQNFLKSKNIQQCLRFTDKGPAIAERVIRTIRSLLKRPVFENGNAGWLSELTSVIKQYNDTIQNSSKMKTIDASEKSNKNEIYSNVKDNRKVRKPRFDLGQLVRTGEITQVFSKADSTN